MTIDRWKRYWLDKKAKRGFQGFPVATVAFYRLRFQKGLSVVLMKRELITQKAKLVRSVPSGRIEIGGHDN